MNKGIVYGIGAYLLWGIFPIFWKLLHTVPAAEIMVHRMVWALVFLALILSYRRHWRWFSEVIRNWRTASVFVVSASLLAVNWFTYIWGVNTGYIVETSLGYFINPLINVLLGVIFFSEKLRGGQWLSIAIAGSGVLYLTISYGALPWIALTLAFTFGFYALVKKKASLNALEGLSLEMAILFVPASAYLLYLELTGVASFGHTGMTTTFLLVMSGAATAVPLLLFAAAARRIPLSVIGILQYIAPTLQFLIGVLVYGEPFTRTRLIGFSVIWLALLIYTVEGLVVRRQVRLRYTG